MRAIARACVPLLLVLGFASCVPWTIRPIHVSKESPEETTVAFSPNSYVDEIWETRLSAAVSKSAVNVRDLLTAIQDSPENAIRRYGHRNTNGPAYYVVQGEGTVVSLDTRSRVGLALVDMNPFDSKPDISIQIGPVLRGTSLRDATDVIPFSHFVNQLQYADVSRELNDRVLSSVLKPIDRTRLRGKVVAFVGTLQADANAPYPLAELVPWKLSVKEDR